MQSAAQSQVIENASGAIIEGSVAASSATGAHDNDGLNPRQREFVDWYCSGVPAELCGREEGKDALAGDGKAAALAAGYAECSAANMAARNLLNPKIQAEIERRVRMGRGSALLVATSAMLRVAMYGTDERAIVAAGVALADRFGLAPPKTPLIDARSVNLTGTEVQNVIRDAVADLVSKRAQRIERQEAGVDALPAPSSELFD